MILKGAVWWTASMTSHCLSLILWSIPSKVKPALLTMWFNLPKALKNCYYKHGTGLARSEEQMYILYGLFDQAFSELGVHDVARNSDSLAASGVDVSSNLLGLLCCHMHVLIEILQGLCYACSRTASSLPASISVTVTIAPSRAKSSAQLLPIPWLLCMNRRMHWYTTLPTVQALKGTLPRASDNSDLAGQKTLRVIARQVALDVVQTVGGRHYEKFGMWGEVLVRKTGLSVGKPGPF